MIRKFLTISFFSFMIMYAAPQDELSDIKEKNEVMRLKEELIVFYNRKEEEYQKNKKELEDILKTIEDKNNEIMQITNQNEALLNEIRSTVDNKTSKIYDSMKPKVAASIFNKMMSEGNVEDVFDIIIKLKESNVTNLMRYLDVEYAAVITEMLKEKSKK